MKHTEAHIFAIYFPSTSDDLQHINLDATYTVRDKLLHHRVANVLRMKTGNDIILFDKNRHITCKLESISKKDLTIRILKKEENVPLLPQITFFLPLLKRDAYEETLYSLTELGANKIQPIITEKIHRMWHTEKERERNMRIIYAAAEQAKNFCFPELAHPIHFNDIFENINFTESALIFFDPDGKELSACMTDIQNTHVNLLYLMIGPEGDLSTYEKEVLKKHSAHFCKLTPTVLRAQQAAAIALGAIRSLITR